MESKEIGNIIKDLRETLGYTQAEIAEMTGIKRPNIARFESGRHTPSLSTLLRITDALGVGVHIGPVRL